MDELKNDLAATREGLQEVRQELAERPTRRQFHAAVLLAVVGVIAVALAAYFAIRSAASSDDAAKNSAATQQINEDVLQGFAISTCRTNISAATVGAATQALEEAEQVRASAMEARDNITIEALEHFSLGNEDALRETIMRSPAIRDRVAKADAEVQKRLAEAQEARVKYQDAITRSIQDPDAFYAECLESQQNE